MLGSASSKPMIDVRNSASTPASHAAWPLRSASYQPTQTRLPRWQNAHKLSMSVARVQPRAIGLANCPLLAETHRLRSGRFLLLDPGGLVISRDAAVLLSLRRVTWTNTFHIS